VERHGGCVTVESAPGVGSTFRIYLPRVDALATAPSSDADALVVTHAGETVLVVEDEDSVRAFTVDVLRQAGYTLLEARDGNAALDLAGRHAGPIDLLVCDLVMPGLMGSELAERLMAARPETRTLFMTGYASLDREGLGALLYKPFTPAALTRRVREALDATATA
jgi:CheY-like chemotaxis protein